jgi:hypothetical protein
LKINLGQARTAACGRDKDANEIARLVGLLLPVALVQPSVSAGGRCADRISNFVYEEAYGDRDN